MPNWCSTTFSFYHNGTKEGEAALADLHDKIEEYTKEPSRVKNGFGPKWLGNVADGFGIDWNTVECRGEIIDITDVENDGGYRAFRVYTETAWGPMPDMWEEIIGQRYQDQIMFEYIAEEPGNGVFINTDCEGIFFPDRYRAEKEDDDEFYEEYFTSDEELEKFLKEKYGIEEPTFDSAREKAAEFGCYVNEYEYR